MKTFYRLLAMLLACTLLLGLGMTAACADTDAMVALCNVFFSE